MVWYALNHFGQESGIGLSGEQSEQEYQVRIYPQYAYGTQRTYRLQNCLKSYLKAKFFRTTPFHEEDKTSEGSKIRFSIVKLHSTTL